jgi:drug/metabolite transporter (DMT)-like permease
MDGLGKYLANGHSVAQVVWARYAFAVPVVMAVAGPRRWRGLLNSDRLSWQAARALLPLLASVSVIVGLTMMPLADFTAISFASPLLVVALSVPLLGERITLRSWIGVIGGFAGVLVIVRPGAGSISWTAAFPLATAFCFALYQVMTRLVSRSDDPVVTLAWTIVVGLVLMTLVLPFQWQPVALPAWLLLALSGVLFGLAHFLVIRAFALAQASLLAPFTYAQLVGAVIFGSLVFGQMPDATTFIGAGLVVCAGIYVLRRQDTM